MNPFLGVLQIIETADGRALSPDGLNWEIQLFGEFREGWGSLDSTIQLRLFRYGVWSAEEGLARFPMPPTVPQEAARHAAGILIDDARAATSALPFPLGDRYELWLLDASGTAPLALLYTATEAPTTCGSPPGWRCATADATGLARETRDGLEEGLRRRTDRPAHSRWFRRDTTGGQEIIPGSREPCELALPHAAFPPLLIDETWPDAATREYLDRYLDWAAPRLLMLPLDETTRARLERTGATGIDGGALSSPVSGRAGHGPDPASARRGAAAAQQCGAPG